MPLEINGYTAHISCHDEELRLYNVTKEDDKTVTCWVASKGGEVCSL